MKLAENPEFPADTNQFPNNQQPDSADTSQNFEDTLHTDFEVTFNLPGVDADPIQSDDSDAESYASAPAESDSEGEAAEDAPPAVGLAAVDADVEAEVDAIADVDEDLHIMDDLRNAIVNAFAQVGRSATISMPTFSGKKGDKPEDHVLRFNDYFNHYNIPVDQKSEEFVKTLTGKARTWIESVPKTARDAEHPIARLPVFDHDRGRGPSSCCCVLAPVVPNTVRSTGTNPRSTLCRVAKSTFRFL